jgi:hypothetical protein
MPQVEVKLSIDEFEKVIADSPSLKKLYEKVVAGTMEMSGEDEQVVKAIVANLILSSIMKPKEEGKEVKSA